MTGDNLWPYLARTTHHPLDLRITRAEGSYVYDESGRKYIDMIAGLAVNNIGHRHPEVVSAVKDQLDRYLHVIPYGEFHQGPQEKLAQALTSALAKNLNTVYLVNSGTEANEAAIKLAKRYTGRHKIVSCWGSYHGSTQGSLSITGNEQRKYAFRPLLPGIEFIRFNEEADLFKIDRHTGAVIIEPVQGDSGVRIPDQSYMTALRKKCNESGALLIFDEVQTGFGRTGKLFAYEHFEVIPDMITLAKGLGGGMPLGAFISSREIMETLTCDPPLGHITTFGGHPVSCAAAIANLKLLTGGSILDEVESKGKLIESLLASDRLTQIRRIGLMLAVEFENKEQVRKVVLRCLEKGVITFWFLSCPDSFRLSPPLTITEDEIREACHVIKGVIDSL